MMIDALLALVKKHENWRQEECLNLIPSENIMSPNARRLLSSDLGHRYTARDRYYMGTHFTDEIEQYGEKLAKDLFNADMADLRPLSGHIADWIILANFAKQGDTLLCVSPQNGGYPGMWNEGLAGLLKLKTVPFPFSERDWNISAEKAKEAITRIKPKVVIFGASLILFPHPTRELANVARENGAFVGFDGSHVLGLVAGGQFQDPLREGVHALFGSTHKSLFGPQGGIILSDKEHGDLVKEKIYPAFVDNAHWNRIAALALTLAEMKEFGRAYAKQVIRNSQALAKALYENGFPVICQHRGFTSSHQVIMNYQTPDNSRTVAEKLQDVHIITDCVIRLGTCEVTRRGMKEEEMLRIAGLIKRAIIDEESVKSLRKDVAKLTTEFQGVEYCYSE